MTDADFLRQAIAAAREGIAAGQSPFGSVIVRDGVVIAAAHNTVWRDTDPTAHAEVNNIRAASRARGAIDLSDCTLYSTCEPCPMCLSAIHWAKIRRVVYGAGIDDAAAAGFSELRVAAGELARMGGSKLVVEGGLLLDECRELFEEFRRVSDGKRY
ncbi:MAG TPA: nucleoside deaminase [Candidatus Solibacter sp.]|nr:nucleoside deaminase [Candidatus Solibacter sp.]